MSGASAATEAPERKVPDYILQAIYGKSENKLKVYEQSLTRWWAEYSDRKNDEEDEHVSDSLLYDRNHLPRMAPPPECVHEAREQLRREAVQGPLTPDVRVPSGPESDQRMELG